MKNFIIIISILIIPVLFYIFTDKYMNYNFADANTIKTPKILVFSSVMCRDCQQMKATIKKVSPDYKNKINFVIINALENKKATIELIKQYNVTLVPTLIYINKSGEIVRRHEGAVSEDVFKNYLEELLNE